MMTGEHTYGVILVGHGAVPKDYPRELVTKLRTLRAQRRTSGAPPAPEEEALETRLRKWPRTPLTDPYQAGLLELASHVQPLLPHVSLTVAYLEFCAPTLEEAVDNMVSSGIQNIVVVPSMLTSGGVHSEVDIPEILAGLRKRLPTISVHYAWPFDQHLIARALADHLSMHMA